MSQDIVQNAARNAPVSSFDALAPLSSRALFWRAGYVGQSTFLEHIPLLFWIVANARPGIIVSLGVVDAVPYFAACQALDKLNLEAVCFGIEADSAADLGPVMAHYALQFPDLSEILIGEHTETAQTLQSTEIDLLIVNQPVTQALADESDQSWLPLLSDHALALFAKGGDTAILPKYADRIAVDGGVFVVEASRGVRLVLRGDQHDERLMRLARLKPGKLGYMSVRYVFSRIGELQRTSFEMDRATSNLGNTRKQRDKAIKDLEGKDTQLSDLNATMAQIAGQLKMTAGQVATMRSEAFDDKAARAALEYERDAAVARADQGLGELGKLSRLHEEQDRALQEARQQNDALKAELEGATRTVADLRAMVTSQEEAQRQNELALTRIERERDDAAAIDGQRYEELAKLVILHEEHTRASQEVRQQRDALKSEALQQRADSRALRQSLSQMEETHRQEDAAAKDLRDENEALKTALDSARADMDQRFKELGTMARMLEERDGQIAAQSDALSSLKKPADQNTQALDKAAQELNQARELLQREQLHHRTAMQLAAVKEEILIPLQDKRADSLILASWPRAASSDNTALATPCCLSSGTTKPDRPLCTSDGGAPLS